LGIFFKKPSFSYKRVIIFANFRVLFMSVKDQT